MLDPAVHKKAEPTNKSVDFTNKIVEIKTNTVILDSVAIEEYAKDVDFTVDYNYTTETLIITALNEEITGSKTVAYNEIDLSKITKETIIGGMSAAGEYTGLASLSLLYPRENQVANLLGAPGYSEIPDVYAKMINVATKINGHWDAFVMADLPVKDEEGSPVDTITAAKSWRKTNGYDSERSEIFWPQHKDVRTGRIYHDSTLAIVCSMITDYSHDSIPFESCSNKEVPSGVQYFGENSKTKVLTSQQQQVI